MDTKKLYSLPIGVQNYLQVEYYNKQLTTDSLFKEFSLWGYDRIEVAPLEFYANFSSGRFEMDETRLLKFADIDSNLVVLTPDMTMPIVKIASRIQQENFPLRLCYGGNIFDNKASVHTKARVQYQAGIELLGISGAQGDTEVITLAIKALQNAGLKSFKIDIGHVDFLKGIMQEYNIDSDEIYHLAENKNMLGVSLALKRLGAREGAYDAISSALSLFGGSEVIKEAKKLTTSKISLDALAKLESVTDKLTKIGLGDYITIDLGFAPRLSYYSGIVFRGLTEKLGSPVLSGGRYDKLSEEFSCEIPACGFAIDVKKLLIAKDNENTLQPLANVDYAVCGEWEKAFSVMNKKRGENKRVVYCDAKNQQQLRANRGDLMKEYITFALAKGRLGEKGIELLNKIGVDVDHAELSGRKLQFFDKSNKFRFLAVKPSDVPTYVEHGVADCGIVGYDTILEEDKDVYEMADLKFGKCKICLAAKNDRQDKITNSSLKVATKYVNVAKNYFDSVGENVEIIKLNGSVELGAALGLSDVILDIVESGATLKANDLVVIKEICDVSARFIVNKVSLKTESTVLKKLINDIKKELT